MSSLGYRPALDGVRGIAVLLVVASHTPWAGFDGGGFVGVPMFFVLSGFLITTLLLEERHDTGRIDLLAFYRRRAYRLLPAVVVLAAAVAGYLALQGMAVRGVTNFAAAVFYVANLRLASGVGMPFLNHTWSLSLEEQFYLVWPVVLLVLLARGVRERWIVTGLVLLTAASALARLRLWLDEASNVRLHYGVDTRADALLIGCLLAFALSRRHWRVGTSWLVVGGGGLVACAVLIDGRDTAYPYGLTVIALVAAAFTAWALHAPPSQRALLEHRALVRVGRLSYGLYLWHYPILTGGRNALEVIPDPARTLVLLAVTWVVTELSWRVVETPFLRRKARRARRQDETLTL